MLPNQYASYSSIGADSSSSSRIVQKQYIFRLFVIGSCVAIMLLVYLNQKTLPSDSNMHGLDGFESSSSDASFDNDGRFVMHNYDQNKPFSNFLPGLGGLFGVPMWTFYVNRGQGVAGFGVSNKDGAIMKFNSAEKAYQLTNYVGFRTFIKGFVGNKAFQATPFARSDARIPPARVMMTGTSEMEIQETDYENGLQTNILYFTVTDEDFPALVRQTTFKNLNNDVLKLDVLDGLAKVIPAGLSNFVLDGLGRTMEAWMNVYNIQDEAPVHGDNSAPFFHISQGTADTAQIQVIKEGHFVVSFIDEEGSSLESNKLLPFLVDPTIIFGFDTELSTPSKFWDTPIDVLLKQEQTTTSRTPCSFAGTSLVIPIGASVTITSVYGHADSLDVFVNSFKDKVRQKGFAKSKRAGARSVVHAITDQVASSTSSKLLDKYTEQSYLDNVLRGGLPLQVGNPANPKIYHVYSRIHGDLERDYNDFLIEASAYSQGPGNFRDVNQNRRVDVLINPFVEDFNVKMFLSFIQADGFNPLTVAGTNFRVAADRVPLLINELQIDNVAAMTKIFQKPFRIGSLLKDVKAAGIKFYVSREEFVKRVMNACEQHLAARFNQNGYWADHWTYTLDQLDSYLAVYPEKEESLLYGTANIPFYMSPALMRSRADRYVALNITGFNSTVVRVYNAVTTPTDPDYPKVRKVLMEKMALDPDYVSDSSGAANMWQRSAKDMKKAFFVTPIAKLAILGLLKFSSLDQSGFGVEMEGGKPGWNDAMNGLPGIIGSGMPETYEMLRIVVFIKRTTAKFNRGITFPAEFATFLEALRKALAAYQLSDKSFRSDILYWDASNNAREVYRDAVNTTFSGETVEFASSDFLGLLTLIEDKVRSGIAKSIALTHGNTPSYFYHEVTAFTSQNWSYDEKVFVAKPLDFKLHTVPLFLEGATRQLKTVNDLEQRRAIYQSVKNSNMYDSALKMYKLSESIATMGQDVGRMKAFSPGWLENQSVWLHMSYKFYLELLRGGLYEEFYSEMITGLVPFMPFEVYGRSPLEASSFIVSSEFPDKRLHGAGFLARLSGSTAEYMSMWLIMMAGVQPFVYENGILALRLTPVLSGWLFTSENTVSFTFLGTVKVTYHNPTRLDTWKMKPKAGIMVTNMEEKITLVDASSITGDLAVKVRNREVKSIDLYY